MRKSRLYVLFPGYGTHLRPDLQRFLQKGCSFLRHREEDLYKVIVSGGCTERKSNARVSEAAVMGTYILEHTSIRSVQMHRDTEAYTSIDNVRNAGQVIRACERELRDSEGLSVEVVIFCEMFRSLKFGLLARRYLSRYSVEIRGVSWRYHPVSPVKQLVSTTLELTATYVPMMAWGFRRYRMWSSQFR